MLGAGVKNMLVKRKVKKAQGEVKEVAPQVIKALSGMPRLREPDRSPDEVPTKRLNHFNYGEPIKRYNDTASALPRKEFKEIIQEKAKDPNNKGAQALVPLLRFCGGKSKPYKKK